MIKGSKVRDLADELLRFFQYPLAKLGRSVSISILNLSPEFNNSNLIN